MKIENRTQAKIALKKALTDIARKAAIARNISQKFYPVANVTAGAMRDIANLAIETRDIVAVFPEA
jgi:hypothetical protein